jgi:hypothetical protein
MSSVKLSSSGGGSVSLSAASTSTDVTIKFPSGNSSAGQALVAGNTSGELDWETVPNSTAVPLLRLAGYNTTSYTEYVSSGGFSRPIEWVKDPATIGSEFETDTHSAWDATNYWYVVPQAGFYRVNHQFLATFPTFADTTKVHRITSGIARAAANNKTGWNDTLYIKVFNRRDQEASTTSYEHSAILECAAGEVIKTSVVWDKGTDTNNTTTSIALRLDGVLNALTNQSLSIEFLRPS